MLMLDVVRKALEGTPISENDYPLRTFSPRLQELVREHGIRYEPGTPIPNDGSLADSVFEAAVALVVDVGGFCMDSGRTISYTDCEVREGLNEAPDKICLGEGRDRKVLVPRRVRDTTPPWCLLGAAGGAVSCDSVFMTLMEGYAEIEHTDAITTPALTTAGGMRVRPKSPLELLAAMRNATMGREACNRAGRPGIPFMNTLSTAESDIALAAALHPKHGLRPSDGFMIASMDPMKVDFARLNKATAVHAMGAPVGIDFSPLMGGYGGGPEGTAVSAVAHHIFNTLTFQASYMVPFPLHLRYVSNSSREMLWIISVMGQAISRNTHLLSISLNYCSAGPCTPMALRETSASVLSAVASGLSIESVGTATNKYEDRMTPVEPRISAEVAHAVAGIRLDDANDIALALLKKYEGKLMSPPLGKTLFECWDADRRRPSREYMSVIGDFKKEMRSLGVDLPDERC